MDWKNRLQKFLNQNMKLTLSQEKTLITDIRKKHIKFLGYEFKMVPGKSRRGYIPRTLPDRDRLKRKADKIAEEIKNIPRNYNREQLIAEINRINSQIRGIIQYYQCCTWVSVSTKKHSWRLQLIAKRRLKQYNGKWIPAKETQNLPRIHQQYEQTIPAVKYHGIYIRFTALSFCKWERTASKNQEETPYTEAGRQLHFQRTKKKRIHARLDEMYPEQTARAIIYGKQNTLTNFEFIMNRAYALNCDKLKCRVCGGWLITGTPYAHRSVSFDIPTGPNEIIEDGVNGYLVEPFDCEDMAEKLARLMADEALRTDFAAHAQDNIEKFRLEGILRNWNDVLDRITSGGGTEDG